MAGEHRGFPCPVCGAPSHTLDTGNQRRRRECRGAELHRFTTLEVLVTDTGTGTRMPEVAPIDAKQKVGLTSREVAILKLLTEVADHV